MQEENNNQKVIEINIEDEMKKSYLDYAMSVIVARALPDVRDGLKPVHRRILYAMHELGLTPDKSYKKSVRIVGDVLGKYHPHGDQSVYDAMVRMAQSFSIRYELVDGHGNFGSVDGDGAAAMRYTEAKMAKISMEMLRDIEKETVDYRDNFDGSFQEPTVLPSKFPNLLVNGTNGIAVGMATSIPPHNLSEVIDGTIALIDNPELDLEGLMMHIKGPDFPTGGIIHGKSNIVSAYKTGRGRVVVRAKTEIQEFKNSRFRIVVTELPYQVNKARLIEKIADLVRDKYIEGISDLRDESDRNGMKIVIELKRDANPQVVLNNLYKHTQLQDVFSIILLSLVDGIPKVLNIKQIIGYYIAHQKEIIERRTKYDLNKAEKREHILKGLLKALDHIDEIIKTIRASRTVQEAREQLINKFQFSEEQAKAILEMRLQKLTGLEREKIIEELEELEKIIAYYREILSSEEMLFSIVKEELLEVKARFSDERRTAIEVSQSELQMIDMIKKEDVIVTLTKFGYIKRIPNDTYRAQNRGGKGMKGLTTREEDFVENLYTCSTHDDLLFFTDKGKVYSIKVFQIQEASRQAKGTNIVNLINLEQGEKVHTMLKISSREEDKCLFFATKNGIIKKSCLSNYKNIRKNGLFAIQIKENDELINVRLIDPNSEGILVTKKGMAIRFSTDDNEIRPIGRTGMGVRGIRLSEGDEVVNFNIIEDNADLLVVSERGYGKRTDLEQYRQQNRGGKGIRTYHIRSHTGELIGARVVSKNQDVMMITQSGIVIRLEADGISKMGRNTQGVKLMDVSENDMLATLVVVEHEDENTEEVENNLNMDENNTNENIENLENNQD